MKTKLHDVLRLALARFLLGLLGTWCVLGPIVIFMTSGSAGWAALAALVVLLFLCYGALLVICLRTKWSLLTAVFSATHLAMCFMIAGLVFNEITGIMVDVKHKLVVLYAFIGFLIAEFIKPLGLRKVFAKVTAEPTDTSGERVAATEHVEHELTTEGALATEMAGFSNRLTEDQQALIEEDKQENPLVKLENHNRQLEELINSVRSELNDSMVRVRETIDNTATLQCEIAALKQQIAEQQAPPASFQSLAQCVARIQFDNQEIRFEDQRLGEELDKQRNQLYASDNRLKEVVRRSKGLADGQERLNAEVAEIKWLLGNSQSKDREMAAVIQQLANIEARGTFYREREQRLEARFIAMEQELSEHNTRTKLLDDALQRLREIERVCQDLTENRPALGEVVADANVITGNHREKLEADWLPWTSLKRQWRFGAAAASVIVIGGAVVIGVLQAKFSTSKEVAVKSEEVARKTIYASREPRVDVVSSQAIKRAPRLRGTFMTVRPTQVYSGPSENTAFIADIGAGIKLNVVNSSHGWLEIRSRHGRPPGFIRQDAARVVQKDVIEG